MAHVFQRRIANHDITIETGRLALQAGGSVYIQVGDTALLGTATAAAKPRDGVDFLPLTVDYEEKLYAAGKIPGSFFRREGRPSTEAILVDRLTDRPIRPLLPKMWRNETQIVITTLSADQVNPPDVLGMVAASAALSVSDIPFAGPLGACRIGYVDGDFVVNPTFEQISESDLDLVIAGTKDAVMMVEAGANIVDEDLLLEAIRLGQEVNFQFVEMQEEMVAAAGKTKRIAPEVEDKTEITNSVTTVIGDRLREIVASGQAKGERSEATDALENDAVAALEGQYESGDIVSAVGDVLKAEIRRAILEDGKRPDGRGLTDIRPISTEVSLLPRTHGTGLFTRGETQVLTITTLASMGLVQKLDTLSPEDTKRFMHHYNFPPFSVGEAGRIGTPGRRDIGHGALAERALLPVIPSEVDFPYTIRLVSEVLGSNGSSSMGSVCGGTLSLMDAGVPIANPVAGAAMGLVTGDDGKYAVLTDIQGVEDFLGDMDFKVAGTSEGVTALQMDIKIKGISYEIMREALDQAKDARLFILDKMLQTIDETRPEMSPFAPRMVRLQIPEDRIGTLIGPGGKTIRGLIEEYNVSIDVENDGSVFVGSADGGSADQAIDMIQRMTKKVEIGDIYDGKVTKTANFGAFVEILPGRDGMVPIGELENYRVPTVEDVVNVGDEVKVLVTDIDNTGRIRLSRRALLENDGQNADRDGNASQEEQRSGGGDGSRFRRDNRGQSNRDDRSRGPRRDSRGDRPERR
ncbi:MAG: polyribonucleotide nucleotidyltransferase [SAR202 cluster bacterium]|nr:polyribonucleotide nucleotidyltransferase [SAR202 cluster bacterium]